MVLCCAKKVSRETLDRANPLAVYAHEDERRAATAIFAENMTQTSDSALHGKNGLLVVT